MTMRPCELCGFAGAVTPLHNQRFLPPGTEPPFSYDVVACPRCNFLYATSLPNVDASYYVEANHHLNAHDLPLGLAHIHNQFRRFIEEHVPNLSPETTILDIGASMGHFLNGFKEKGYNNLTGLEASRNAQKLAKERYGLHIVSSTLESFHTNSQFQLATLCGVLEHLTQLDEKIQCMASLLHQDGYLFIAVPDASRFVSNRQGEPFLEFASEHINFFTPKSLDSLLHKNGFTPIAQSSIYNNFYENHQLMALYRRAKPAPNQPLPENTDFSSVDVLKAYIAEGNRRLNIINHYLEELVNSQESVIIWGTGQLTARLLATSDLAKLKIEAFVDNNIALHGNQYFGRQINDPKYLSGRKTTLLIASLVHADAIRTEAHKIPRFSGKILTLPAYNSVTQ